MLGAGRAHGMAIEKLQTMFIFMTIYEVREQTVNAEKEVAFHNFLSNI